MTEKPQEPFKNLFDFIHTTLGFSPGGDWEGNTLVINHKFLSEIKFKQLAWAYVKYRKDWPETKLPDIEFRLSFLRTFEEQMFDAGKVKTVVGDTIFWER